jgi:hypothetical protein
MSIGPKEVAKLLYVASPAIFVRKADTTLACAALVVPLEAHAIVEMSASTCSRCVSVILGVLRCLAGLLKH